MHDKLQVINYIWDVVDIFMLPKPPQTLFDIVRRFFGSSYGKDVNYGHFPGRKYGCNRRKIDKFCNIQVTNH